MARRTALLSSGILLAAVGCQEAVTAPGACPEYCRETSFEVLDSVIGAVVRDSSYRGFVASNRSFQVQAVKQTGGLEARMLFEFVTFSNQVPVSPGDTLRSPVTAIDSFAVEFSVARREAGRTGVMLNLHQIGFDPDSSTTYQDLDPFFDGSALVTTVNIPDTLEIGATRTVLPGTAFGALPQDSLDIVLGVEIAGPDSTFVSLGATTGAATATIRRYFGVDSAGTVVKREDARTTRLVLTAPSAIVPDVPGTLSIGGIPSARSILRVDGIEEVLSNTSVIRATLEFTPAMPVIGAPGDSVGLRILPVSVDFGRKSPLIETQIDELERGVVRIPTGSAAPFEVDVTTILRAWAGSEDLPRALMLTALAEASNIGEVRILSSAGAQPPRLRVTYVPPVGLSN